MGRYKKWICCLLVMCLAFAMFPFSVQAEFVGGHGGEKNANLFADGDGTRENPYQVSNANQLDAVRNDMAAYYIQTADIDLNGWDWKPIGHNPSRDYANSESFRGNFDGNGYTISNMTITSVTSENESVGLFSLNNGVLQNINLVGLVIDLNVPKECYYANIGGIAGTSYGKITNCTADGKIQSVCDISIHSEKEYQGWTPIQKVGGIVGAGECSYCTNYVDINVNSQYEIEYMSSGESCNVYCGGIVGSPNSVNGEIINCVNYGNISASADGFALAGGISGNNGSFHYCVNYGDVNSNSTAFEVVTYYPQSNAGGIVGVTSADLSCHCVNFGNVSATKTCKNSGCNAGGIVGYLGYYSSGYISDCYNLGQSVHADITYPEDPNDPTLVDSSTYVGAIHGDWYYWNSESRANNCFSINSTTLSNIKVDSVVGYNGTLLSDYEINQKIKNIILTLNLPWAGDPDSSGNSYLSVRFFNIWDAENQIAYFGTDPAENPFNFGSQVTEETDTSFLENVDELVGKYVLAETKIRDDGMLLPDTLISITLVDTWRGIITEIGDSSFSIDGTAYTVAERLYPLSFAVGDEVLYHLYNGEIVGIKKYDGESPIPGNPNIPDPKPEPEPEPKPETDYKLLVTPEDNIVTIASGQQLIITCRLSRNGVLVTEWNPQVSIEHEGTEVPVVYLGCVDGGFGRYYLNIEGIEQGRAVLTISDSNSGACTNISVEVGPLKLNTIKYWDDLDKEEKATQVYWGYDLFTEDSEKVKDSAPESYEELVKISALLSNASYDLSNGGYLQQTLKQLGAEDIQIMQSGNVEFSYPAHSISHVAFSQDGVQQNVVIVTVRGSSTVGDWLTDFNAYAFDSYGVDSLKPYKVHGGFLRADERIRAEIITYLQENNLSHSTNKILITGHSYGGAIANLLANSLEVVFGRNNIFAYTFASPNNIVVKSGFEMTGNIHNFRYKLDPVVRVPFTPSPVEKYTVFGQQYFFALKYIGSTPTDVSIFGGHNCTHYVNYALNFVGSEEIDSLKTRQIQIHCPVDVTAYDENGNIVGRIIDNKMDDASAKIMMYPVGDQKNVFVDQNEDVQLSIVATDSGTMDVIITEYDVVTGNVSTIKEYSTIALKEDKAFSTSISEESLTEDIGLEVVDKEGHRLAVVNEDGTETADISEKHKHTVVIQNKKEATCKENGYSGDEVCSECGTIVKYGISVLATGHDWTAGNCTTPKSCKVCGVTTGGVVHTYSHQYDYKCDVCHKERTVDMTRSMVDMFRMYNPNTGEHFYTGSNVERDNLIGHGWKYEGVGFTFPMYTGKPVYRLFQPSTGEHLYTMDEAEKAKLLAEGWNYEGVAFNSGFENEVPQYRLHNPNTNVGAYHFTASLEEKNNLIAAGWEYQGIGWYSLGG